MHILATNVSDRPARRPRKRVKYIFASTVFTMGLLIGSGCGSSDGSLNSADLQARLQSIADKARISSEQVRSTLVSVDAPKRQAFAASGTLAPASTLAPTETSGIRIASISKLFTATAIFKLVEEHKLVLDASMAQYLSNTAIKGLSVIDKQDLTNTITIRQLLAHRSGLADYETDGDSDSSGFTKFGRVQLDDPIRFWSLQDTIDWTRNNLTTFSRPGESFRYADTNFQLLGLIIEAITNRPLYAAVREMIFDRVGMPSTFDEFREPEYAKTHQLVHYYLGDTDVTSTPTLSADYASGGWTSSTADLTKFLKTLTSGKIVSRSSYDLMKTKLSEVTTLKDPRYGTIRISYGLGMVIWNVDGLGTFVGHDGFFNSYCFYWVDKDAYLVGSLNVTPDVVSYTRTMLDSANALVE